MITIINYGMGNLGSIINMFHKVGVDSIVTSDFNKIGEATKIVLPGVGSFDNAIQKLNELNLIDILTHKVVKEKIPILGICLGMQLFTTGSEEGSLKGLGWIDAETVKFKFNENAKNFKIPHMGWNNVYCQKETCLFKNMYDNPRFYFVHSYYVKCNNERDILATTDYGFNFVSALEKENIYGVQFHPEKSHKFGIKIFENFVGL